MRTTERISLLASSAIFDSYNRALSQAIREANNLNRLKWHTCEDEKVCTEICAPMHGVIFTIEQSEGILPAHGKCRCTWTSMEEE